MVEMEMVLSERSRMMWLVKMGMRREGLPSSLRRPGWQCRYLQHLVFAKACLTRDPMAS